MAEETSPFDVAEYLDSPEMIAAYIEDAMAENDPAMIRVAIGNVARALGMTKIAKDSGLKRESLYKAFSERGNPTLSTLAAVFKTMGLKLSVQPMDEAEDEQAPKAMHA